MAGTYELPYTGNQVEILLGKVSQLEVAMPTKVSDLTNDTGFITAASLPTKTSDLINDSGFITSAAVPTKVSQLQNDSSFATTNQLGTETSRAQGVEGGLRTDVDAINAKIPSAAAANNQLADKAFVNSSISTAGATFRGTYTSLADLQAVTADENDYGFVQTTDSAGNTVYKRYKYSGGSWVFEYDLNNSSFTSSQWNAINSGITQQLVATFNGKYTVPQGGIPKADMASDVQTSLGNADSAYQKPGTGIPKTDLSSDVQTSLGKADTAIQDVSGKADKDTDAVTGNIAKFDANHNPVDSGIPSDNVAQKDGSYDSMAVGIAKNLEGRSLVTESFFERPTGGEDAEVANGLAQLNEVRGRSVKFNQLVQNGDFSNGTTGWAKTGGNISASNGVCTLAITVTTNLNATRITKTITTLTGHKYLVSEEVNPSKQTAIQIGISNAINLTTRATVPANTWTIYRDVFSVEATSSELYLYCNKTSSLTSGDSVKYRNINLIDLTAIFGSDANIAAALGITTAQITTNAGVAAFEKWLAENVGTMPYYPYDAGSVINNKMTGMESVGFNLLDPATGKAELPGAYSDVYGNYYGIAGTYGTITFTSKATGETSTITPDADGKFLIESPGELSVASAGADCAVFLWWDGTKTDYEDYSVDVVKLDVTHIYGKKNGEGSLVQVWPTGMPGIGDLKDTLGIVDGEVVAKRVVGEVDMGSLGWRYLSDRPTFDSPANAIPNLGNFNTADLSKLLCAKYNAIITTSLPSSGNTLSSNKAIAGWTGTNRVIIRDDSYTDATTFTTAVTGQKLYYKLATPETYTDLVYQGSSLFADGTPVTLPVNYIVDNWGVERILPKNTSAINTGMPDITARYSLDAIETLNTHADEISDLYDQIDVLDDKKANTIGDYPEMSVGSARNLLADEIVPAEYIFRKTPDEAATGIAAIERLKGKSLVWNQHAPELTSTYWTNRAGTGLVYDYTDGVAHIYYNRTQSGVTAQPNLYIKTAYDYSPILNHKYLVSFDYKTGADSTFIEMQGRFGASHNLNLYNLAANTPWTRSGEIITPTDVSKTFLIWAYISSDTGATCVDFYVRNVQIFDLTLMFGAGNEPSTVAEFEALYPNPYYAYNAGTLVNNAATAIETIGRNQYNPTSGKASVIRGKTYYVGGTYTTLAYSDGTSITVSSNLFTADRTDEVTVTGGNATNTIINLSDVSFNGQYEPYEKHTLTMNIPTLTGKLNGEGESVAIFPEGMKSVGTMYDELVVENGYAVRAIKRIGQIDMGNAAWSYNSNDAIFYRDITGIKQSSDLLCAKYYFYGKYNSSTAYANHPDKSIAKWNNSGAPLRITAKDSSYTDAANFKTAVTGKTLYFQLATPEEYTLDTPIPMNYSVIQGGTERRLPEDTASSVLAPFAADMVYTMDAVNILRHLNENYVSFNEQTVSSEKKQMARQNIGAISEDEVAFPVQTSQPSGGFLPNILYALGTLTGTVSFAMAAAADSTKMNHYYWTFETGSTAPTISSWPSAITGWNGGSAPTIAANKHYEISVLNGIAAYMEV